MTAGVQRGFCAALGVVLAGCAIVPSDSVAAPNAPRPTAQTVASAAPSRPSSSLPVVPAPLAGSRSTLTQFVFAGELTQGGWIKGQTPAGTLTATLGDKELLLDSEGHFFAAFDRDAPPEAVLTAQLADGRRVTAPLTVAPRAWQLERVNVALRPSGSTEAFMARRTPELARIAAARQIRSSVEGWRQNFIWPAKGRISGRFGSQRIYKGEPGAYHSGLDIAAVTGTPFVAPADGVVVLAAQTPFSLEGYLLIIDHGGGLNSAFLHNSSLSVREGEVVRQGQHLGTIGATGRATGPHLHWGLVWQGSRLDPLLFIGPMN